MKKVYKYRILWSVYCICTVPMIPILVLVHVMDWIRDWIGNRFISTKDWIIRKYKPK